MPKRILIVGGVAGGASCATRARRLDESAEIVIFEKGPYPSFANCGLPYYVGKVIQDRDKLLVSNESVFRNNFQIDVRTRHEVTRIDRERKTIEVKNLESGEVSSEAYDALVLSPGGTPIRPPIPGLDLPGIFDCRTIPDVDAIRGWIDSRNAKRAAVVGAGFIGVEVAENLVKLGLQVHLIEKTNQILPNFDREMANIVHPHLEEASIDLQLNNEVKAFRENDGVITIETAEREPFDVDLVVFSIGQRPNAALAKEAGLDIGETGGIAVDRQMRTSDPNIWAVGDAVEIDDAILGGKMLLPLAGPANRQGRIAADAIMGLDSTFRGVQGTFVIGVFDYTMAYTGASEKQLERRKIAFDKVYIHAGDHAGYYPGAETIHLKLLFSNEDRRILGAQAIGKSGVDKRIDVISMAMQKNGTVDDLAEAELCYAPQYGSAKDPVNLAGFVAQNHLEKLAPLAHFDDWLELLAAEGDSKPTLIDVRPPHVHETARVPRAINIPLSELRDRISELDPNCEVWVHCNVGKTSHNATRILRHHGFEAKNVSGGFQTWHRSGHPVEKAEGTDS